MPKKLTDVLEEMRFEYDLGYEPFHEHAMLRAIEILKEKELDEERVDKFNKKFEKGLKNGVPM
jgi:hypothetical protein